MVISFDREFHGSATGCIKEQFCLFVLNVSPTSFPVVLVQDKTVNSLAPFTLSTFQQIFPDPLDLCHIPPKPPDASPALHEMLLDPTSAHPALPPAQSPGPP